MTKKKIFITQKIMKNGPELLKSKGYEVEVWPKASPVPPHILQEKLLTCHGLISMLGDKFDSELLTKAKNLEVIANYAVGFNNIDISAATQNKICVGNTPGVLTDATADLAMALLLNLSRMISPASKNVIDGEWNKWEPLGFLGRSLKGKTLGVFGLGRIGQAFAKRCVDGFGMKLLYTSRSEKAFGERVDLETLLIKSDVISIHSPLTSETELLFNKSNLSKTKKDCILINTARGEIIDQQALAELLRADHFFGVGLDVTAPEPLPKEHELLKFKNVLITPHIGSADLETRQAMSELAARNIIAAFAGEPLPGFVNPEVREHKT